MCKNCQRAIIAFLALFMIALNCFAQEGPKLVTPPLPDAEQQPSVWGFLPMAGDDPPPSGFVILDAAPSAWDWRDYNGVTPIKDQNPCGSCWAFASTGAVESLLLISDLTSYDLSEYNLIGCGYDKTCDSGGNATDAAALLTRDGTVFESCDPYSQCGTTTCDLGTPTCDTGCPRKKNMLGWRRLANDTAEIKDEVYNIGPVYTSVDVAPGFTALGPDEVFYYPGSTTVNHAVLIVGWDDDKLHDGGTGAWLVKNSWGDWWADQGFGWIAYGSGMIGTGSAVYTDYQDYHAEVDVLYYDEAGCNGWAGYNNTETGWGMVRYTPPQNGVLHRVDFWTTGVNTSYKVRVYDDFNGAVLSNLIASKDGSCDKQGFYSVVLDSQTPPEVTAGDEIFVAVEFTVPGYFCVNPDPLCPIPLDMKGPAETNKCYTNFDPDVYAWSVYNDYDIPIRARIVQSSGDSDGDGISNRDELVMFDTDPFDWDSDHDFLPDGYEILHADTIPPLDPLNSLDGNSHFDEDTNTNVHEYYNGTDPWSEDPVCGEGVFCWADAGSGNGVVDAPDITNIKKKVRGLEADYSGVIPGNGMGQDLSGNGVPDAPDITQVKKMVRGLDTSGAASRPDSLVVLEQPGSAVKEGHTCHVTLGVDNGDGDSIYTSGFGVVFTIDGASSTGTATLLGGEGDSDGGRYDVSDGEGKARIVLKIESAGTIKLNAHIPADGTSPNGRWCNEVNLDPAVTIAGIDECKYEGGPMALIPAGCFDMGDVSDGCTYDPDECPVHNVCITSDFYMDIHEVTNAEYKACVNAGACTPPSDTSSSTRSVYYGNTTYDNFPVIYVSWNQATDYCTWAGKRLPTEAEWEYAARGGLAGKRYAHGDTISCSDACYGRVMSGYDCWDYGGLDNDTHQVESYAANGYGLYDMAGNVWEWTNDWYQWDYYSTSPTNDPPGPASGTYRVFRGGGWYYNPSSQRVAKRANNWPTSQGAVRSFRCAGD